MFASRHSSHCPSHESRQSMQQHVPGRVGGLQKYDTTASLGGGELCIVRFAYTESSVTRKVKGGNIFF